MGIAGVDISAELRGLSGALAAELQPAVAAACTPAAAEAAAFYGAFVAYAHGGSGGGGGGEPLLPSLQALQAGRSLPGAGGRLVRSPCILMLSTHHEERRLRLRPE